MTTDSAHLRSKQPRSVVAGPYGHPFHGILVTIPIGSWIASLIFDIAALTTGDVDGYSSGARLLVAIGILGALLAGVVGLIDLSQLEKGTRVRTIGLIHMSLNLVAIALFSTSFALRAGVDGTSIPGMAVGIAGLTVLAASGFLGGELAYRYGVRVADEGTQGQGFTTG
jgi:uncharacterized membrane protein